MEGPTDEATKTKGEAQLGSRDLSVESLANAKNSSKENQSTDGPQ